MGDEQERETAFGLELSEQFQNAGAMLRVQRRHRFVADQQLGFGGQCARDRDALALASRECVWIAIEDVSVEPDCAQQFGRTRATRRGITDAVDAQRFSDELRHSHTRVQRSERILEHHADAPPQWPQRTRCERCDIDSVEPDLIKHDPAALRTAQQTQQRTCQRGFSRTRFAHQCEAFAAMQMQCGRLHRIARCMRITHDDAVDIQ